MRMEMMMRVAARREGDVGAGDLWAGMCLDRTR